MCRTLDHLLALRRLYMQSWQAFGLQPPAYEQSIKHITDLVAAAVAGTVKKFNKEIAPPVAATPHEVVYEQDGVRLLHYQVGGERRQRVPLLLLCSIINRYYILDLTPGRSYVEYLASQGFDVYIIDWGTPESNDITFEDYTDNYIYNAVQTVKQRAGVSKISLLGYCIGGTLALLYAASYPDEIKNLVLMATPVDFTEAGMLGSWADRNYFDADKVVDILGNVPAEMLQWSFLMLRPATNLFKYVNLSRQIQNQEYVKNFIAMETWSNDNVPVPGAFYRRLIKDLYQENLLVQGRFRLGKRTVDLASIDCALLNVSASKDHIVPVASSAAVLDLVSSTDKEQLTYPYGHIALSVSNGAMKEFWPASVQWLAARSDSEPKPARKRKV